jgi:septum formation protein
MLLQEKFKDKKIILGSASPRRKELLAGLDIQFTVEAFPGGSEEFDPNLPYEEIPRAIAIAKSKGFHRNLVEDEILITADTVVVCDSEIMGKPHSKEEAAEMLSRLSGKVHQVITGVCIRSLEKECSFFAISEVSFDQLSAEEIEYYVEKYSPLDKAGSYGIQEWIGYIGINSIKGSYFNIVGLPVQRLYKELMRF